MLCFRLLDKVNEGLLNYNSTLKLRKNPHFHIYNIDPPHFEINNVDVMWINVDVMWSIVEECGCLVDVMWNIVDKCGCFVKEKRLWLLCGTLWRNVYVFVEKCGCNVDDVEHCGGMWMFCGEMWTLHISTFHNLTKSSPLLGQSS